jgi:hypothetical protein
MPKITHTLRTALSISTIILTASPPYFRLSLRVITIAPAQDTIPSTANAITVLHQHTLIRLFLARIPS